MLGALELPEDLDALASIVGDQLARVRDRFDAQLASDLLSVGELVDRLDGYRGKMLRPALVLLAGMAGGDETIPLAGRLTEAHTVVGATVEMIHMATLVHDDVLDEAEVRRRTVSFNRLVGNEMAVILGDYLIASAYHLCSTLQDQRSALEIGRVSMQLCTGELLQLSNRHNLSLDRTTYYEIVDRKTASLIEVACRLGAVHAGASAARADALAEYGRLVGIAFQIQDDLLDLMGDEQTVGKSVGKDLEKGKLTLPIIEHLARVQGTQRGEAIELATRAATGDADAATALASLVRRSGSVEAAAEAARDHIARARKSIAGLPAGEARVCLELMADAVIDRSY